MQKQLEFNISVDKANPIRQRSCATETLRRTLAEQTGMRVELALTRNRVSMASVQFLTESHARIRLHEHFALAPDDIMAALVGYLRSRQKRHWKRICAYARSIPVSPPNRPATCHTKGRIYDLEALSVEINNTFFGGKLRFRVGWGRHSRPAKRRSIRYGSCNIETRLIRIHPFLDQEHIPVDFVRYILYHEVLHLVFPPEIRNGRRIDHPEIFRRWEQRFPAFQYHKELAKKLLREMG